MALVFIFGTIVGSFLNVCIMRIPYGRSIVFPRSRCGCGENIPFYLNVPIVSWILLKGRAACCGRKIGVVYPIVEALTGLLFLAIWLKFDVSLSLWYMFFVSLLIVGSFIDIDFLFIPDFVTIGGMLIALFAVIVCPALKSTENSFLAFVFACRDSFLSMGFIFWIAVLFSWILKEDAMGMGDVKLMGFVGALLGWQACVFSIFFGSILGTVFLFPIIFKQFKLRLIGKAHNTGNSYTRIPFGPFLSIAAVIYLLFAKDFVTNYFATILKLFG